MRARSVVSWLVLLVLLAPACLLTAVRLVDADVGLAIQLVAFTPFAIVLYAVALVLALGSLLVRRRSRARAVVAAVAAVGLALHCWWFAPLLTGDNPPPAQAAEPLTVMAANIAAGGADPVELVRTATEENVDLLVVAEIPSGAVDAMETAGLSELLPFRVGEPSGGRGTMVFARTRLVEIARTDTWADGWVVSMGDLVVVASHPRAPTDPALWRSDHAALLDAVRDHRPDLVLGDLNATLDHAPMRALADAGLRDAGELANQGWQPTWPAGGRWTLGVAVPPLAQIDHVLVGRRLAVLTTRTVALPGSDHHAVVATVART